MANFPCPGSIILRGRGKSRIDPGSEDVRSSEIQENVVGVVVDEVHCVETW